MSVDRRFITHFDWRLFGVAVFLALLGVFAIYTATGDSALRKPLYLKQLGWVLLSILGLLVACSIHHRTLERYAYFFYGFSLLMLALVPFIGQIGLGAQRWIKMGPLAFQPAEFLKLGLILFLARYLNDREDRLNSQKVYLLPAFLTLIPVAFILEQPDLGTAILLFLIALSMMLLAGLKLRYLLPFAFVGLASTPLLWTFLREYQRQRLLTFLNPSLDPLGTGYHLAQSKIAVGSGGLFGKGFLSAPQSQLAFLPQSHTDFIFAVLAEQWGFVGSLLLLLAYAYLLSKGLWIAKESQDRFASFVSFGVTAMLAFQLFINIGMVIGLAPVVGIPLPLLSYGGSSLLATMLALGFLLGISIRRFLY